MVARVLRAREDFEWRFGIRLSYVALCDSQGAVVEPRGISFGNLKRLLAAKAEGRSIANADIGYRHEGLFDIVDVAGTTDAIVLDLTAHDETTDALLLALERGYSVVLANKKPLTGPYKTFRRLLDSQRIRYEATVGAGVPVIATLRETLLAAHDTIYSIEGCLSGTLGYLTTGLQAGHAFSTLVRNAKAMGYTEPDPRDDLGGMDVARKALILARTLGWPLEMEQVRLESLYPKALDQGSIDDFLIALSSLDADYQLSVASARSHDNTLRYVASLSEGKAEVGIKGVPFDSPLGRLQGSDNLITFHSEVYADSPLVLQGRGTDVQGTAAGVLADVVALTRCLH
jgi:homoserine dehydrogenase